MGTTSALPGFNAPSVGFEQPFAMLEACHERVQRTLALLQRQHAGQQGEQGGLAGAVAAEQAQALAGLQLQVDALQGRGLGAGIAVGDIG